MRRARVLAEVLMRVRVTGIAARQPITDRVLRALALAGRAAGEAENEVVGVDVAFDAGIALAYALEQIPEIAHARAWGLQRVHADDGDVEFAQGRIELLHQGVLQEHRLRSNKID